MSIRDLLTLTDSPIEGSIFLRKLTAASIRAMPERAKIKNARVKCFIIAGLAVDERLMPPAHGVPGNQNPDVFTALVANRENWGAVVFDDDGEPNAIYRSDVLFLPTCHIAMLQRVRKEGSVALMLEFWAQPAINKHGYSWYYHNLAKLDRDNLSIADRLLRMKPVA